MLPGPGTLPVQYSEKEDSVYSDYKSRTEYPYTPGTVYPYTMYISLRDIVVLVCGYPVLYTQVPPGYIL